MIEAKESLPDLVLETFAAACSLEFDAVTLETNLLDSGLDSHSLLAIVAQVEALYDIELESDVILELFQTVSVGGMIDKLEELIRVRRCDDNECGI